MRLRKIVMIDTIKLTRDIEKLPSQIRFTKNQKGVIKSIFNPTKEQKSTGKYFPRITFVKQPVQGSMRQQVQIEFSIPNLLYGNNFSEVCDVDFNDVVEALRYAIWQLDIDWRPETPLGEFRVTRIDYGKNITFSDGTTVSQIIKLLNTSSISRAIDVSNGEFRNGGQILHLHTGRRDIAFYDKISDLKRSKISEKRTEEKDNRCQLGILDSLQEKSKLAVLRYEIRLNSIREIKRNLQLIGQDAEDVSLRRLFSSEISRAILLYWWKEIFRTIPKMSLDSVTMMNQLLGLLANPEAKPQRVLATMGALRLYEEPDFDERFVCEVFDKRFKSGSWNRSKKLLLQPEAPKNLQHLLQLEQTIREMRPLKLEDIRTM